MDKGDLLSAISRELGKERADFVPEWKVTEGTEYVPSGSSAIIKGIDLKTITEPLGLRTSGVSTCTAVVGFFTSREGKVGLLLAHVLPDSYQAEVLNQIPTDVEKLSYVVFNGPAAPGTKMYSKNGFNINEHNEWFLVESRLQQKGIKIENLPYESIRRINRQTGELKEQKFLTKGLDASFGVVVKLEEENGVYAPRITQIING